MIRKQPKGECTLNERDLIEVAINLLDQGEYEHGDLAEAVKRVKGERHAN